MIFTSLCLPLKLKQHQKNDSGMNQRPIWWLNSLQSNLIWDFQTLSFVFTQQECLFCTLLGCCSILLPPPPPPHTHAAAALLTEAAWTSGPRPLDFGSSLSGGVGSNPTVAIMTISARQFQSEHVDSIPSSSLPELSPASSQRQTFGERTRICDSKFTLDVNVGVHGCYGYDLSRV